MLYSESHDEVANGQARVPYEIDPTDGHANWFAEYVSTQAAALVFTAPGIPMLFQGRSFCRAVGSRTQFRLTGISPMSTRLAGALPRIRRIALRRNLGGKTRGLTGRASAFSRRMK